MSDYLEDFRANLKYYRTQKGWSQSELAIQADSSNGMIGNIESGKAKPSFDLIIRISTALNIHPADLFLRDASKIQNQKLYRKYCDLIKHCEQIPEYQQASVIHLAESLAEQAPEYNSTQSL